MPTDRISFVDVDFDCFGVDELLGRLEQVTPDRSFGYLVTPNVDHVVRLHGSDAAAAELANAYAGAEYCLCDSKVLALLGRLCGLRLKVIPGSDLSGFIFERIVREGDRIAVVGGDAQLMRELRNRFPKIDIVQHVPPMGLAADPVGRRQAAQFIVQQKARFTFICVGSPQQEMIAAEAAQIGGCAGLLLCVGAALDFLSGREMRAPAAIRYFGLEWAHRLLMNPRRLWRRYLLEGPRIFLLTYRWAQKST